MVLVSPYFLESTDLALMTSGPLHNIPLSSSKREREKGESDRQTDPRLPHLTTLTKKQKDIKSAI